MTSVIAIMNQKGGCGKTTTTINLSAALALKEKKVLTVDFDPQGHASLGLGISEGIAGKTIAEVLLDKINIQDTVIKISENHDLIPSNILLSSLELRLAGTSGREFYLKNHLKPLFDRYDFIIIDCPPQLGFLSVNAVMAASHAVVPIEPSKFALDGAQQFYYTLNLLCEKADHKVEIRHLVSMYDYESSFATAFYEEMKKTFNTTLFQTPIRRSRHIQEASCEGKSVLDYESESLGYLDFMSLAHEVTLWVNRNTIMQILNSAQNNPVIREDGVYFITKAKDARSVQLAGSFNQWNPDRSYLQKITEDTWFTVLPLNKGTHFYKFVVDDKWTEDPNNPEKQTTLFGVTQSVVTVK